MRQRRNVLITGSGSYLPGLPVSNARLKDLIPDLPMDVFSSYFGIDQRYMVVDPETCERRDGMGSLGMASRASRQALERAGLDLQDVDAIITNTTTPESPLPPISFLLQRELGVDETQIYDLRGGCAASVQAMILGKTLIESGQADTVLLCGVECTSPVYYKYLKGAVDPDMDVILNGFIFGDGAGALVLQAGDRATAPPGRRRRIGYCATLSNSPIARSASRSATKWTRSIPWSSLRGPGTSIRPFPRLCPWS
jgi:3-oxoacyl-[acyl-carrier-protein] synthase-3